MFLEDTPGPRDRKRARTGNNDDSNRQSVASSSESESMSMRGISSSSSCSSSLGNKTGLDTLADGWPVLWVAVFEGATVEWRPLVLLIASDIFDSIIRGGGEFVEMTDICSLGSTRGRTLSRKFDAGEKLSVGTVVKLSAIETSCCTCTICGWEECVYVNPRADNTFASSWGSSALKSESDSIWGMERMRGGTRGCSRIPISVWA